jgi:hypothetical protein
LAIVDSIVCAECARDILLMLCSGGCDDSGAECFGDLDGSETDSTGSGVDKDPVTYRVSVRRNNAL